MFFGQYFFLPSNYFFLPSNYFFCPQIGVFQKILFSALKLLSSALKLLFPALKLLLLPLNLALPLVLHLLCSYSVIWVCTITTIPPDVFKQAYQLEKETRKIMNIAQEPSTYLMPTKQHAQENVCPLYAELMHDATFTSWIRYKELKRTSYVVCPTRHWEAF